LGSQCLTSGAEASCRNRGAPDPIARFATRGLRKSPAVSDRSRELITTLTPYLGTCAAPSLEGSGRSTIVPAAHPKEFSMSDKSLTATTAAAATNRVQAWTGTQKKALQKRDLLAAIGGKWGKFSEQELSDLKSEDDLAVQLATKYGLGEDIARRDIAAVMNGRSFQAPAAAATEPGEVVLLRERRSTGR